MNHTFTAAPHHDVLVLVLQVALLLITARAFGFLAQRLGQPAVVGEILSGIVLGPSLISGIFPDLGHWIVPHNETQGYLLEVIALLGAMFLLILTGLETDIPLIRRHAKTAIGVAAGGLILPLTTGFLVAQFVLPDSLLGNADRRLVFSLFVATALSISAIPVIAKVLIDLNLMRRDIGQTIMAAGMVDDTSAWILLSVVLGLAGGEALTVGSVAWSAGKILLFMALSFTLGRWLLAKALDFMQDRVEGPDRLLTLVVAAAFIWGTIAQAIQIEAVLGAFVVGIMFGTMRRLPTDVVHKLEAIALAIFAPIFFAVAGLKVDLPSIFNPQQPELIFYALLVLLIAIFGKMAGAYAGGRLIGLDHWRSLAYGSALNARGAVEIIIATIGFSLGIISQNMYSIIVVMAVVTSLMAPSLLRWALKHVTPDEQESKRLRQEELTHNSLLGNVDRVLLPVRQRPGEGDERFALQQIETTFVSKLGDDLALTLLNITAPGKKAEATHYLNEMGELFRTDEISKKVIETHKVLDTILDEAEKDYGLLILGASEKPSDKDAVFNPLTDKLVQLSPCPTMIVKGVAVAEHWPPKRILVPTNGSNAARNAAEVAFTFAQGANTTVSLLHVVERVGSGRTAEDISLSARERQMNYAHEVVETLRELGEAYSVQAEAMVRVGRRPEAVILAIAERYNYDLIVLGTGARQNSARVFLGPRVENILDNAPCPVIVVNA